MNMSKLLCRAAVCAALVAPAGSIGLWAQNTPVRSRVVETVDDTRTVRLQGNVHPLARVANDQGALADSQPMTRMLLLLQRSQEQELALRQLMDAQLTKGSGSYHAWLTPEQFGKQFGPADADVQAVTDWLTREGFQVKKVAAGRTVVEFDGNAGQVRNAFHTEIHRYVVNGEEHFANASDPAIPEALSPVVAGVVALNNFPKHTHVRRVGTFQRDLATGQVKPLFTYTDLNGTFYGVGPADFATIYNITGWPAVGAGQSIAIVGQTNINIQDVNDFRSMFGLSANPPNIILNGPDPGIVGPNVSSCSGSTDDEVEADLDVEWAGAVAPQATIDFVVSQTTCLSATQVTQGIDLSALYVVDNNIAPVMSDSYGSCEANLGTAGNAFYNSLWEQAAAEGITVVVAAGDNGSAGCDPAPAPANQFAATQGLAVSGLASTPFDVAVGGTDFDQSGNFTTYWNASNTAPTQVSAKGYIPEKVWDDSTCAANYLANPTAAPCSSVDTVNSSDLAAGSGGPSNCAVLNGSGSACAGYPKPAFQSQLTPADSARDLPDISLFAGDGNNRSFFIICQSDVNPSNAPCDLTTSGNSGTHNFSGVGGTSGATPSFAAIVALVNQQTGQRQGNINYPLYNLGFVQSENASSASCNSSAWLTTPPPSSTPNFCSFYDITAGTNTVACVGGTPNCSNSTGSGFGVITSGNAAYNTKPPNAPNGITEGTPAFTAVAGYDLATGLGSVNVGNLLANWHLFSRTPTTTTLTSQSGNTNTSGQNFSFTVAVSPTPPVVPAPETVSINALSPTGAILGSVGSGTNGNGFTLNSSGSTGSVTTNLLPPGTASLVATYGGDVTLAMSTSAPLPLTVSGANLPSKTTLNFTTFSPTCTSSSGACTNIFNVPYGSPYILQIVVTNSGGTSCINANTTTTPSSPCPTGTIALTDNAKALNDWPIAGQVSATNIAKLNNQGLAEDQPIQLGVGSHSLVASFTPSSTTNTNFQASSSSPLSVAITQASTSTLLGSNLISITPGTSVTLTAYVVTASSGAGPTGSIQLSNGSTSLGSATCQPTSGLADINPPISQISVGSAYCVATMTTTISSLYPPPTARPGAPAIPRVPLVVALLSLLLFVLGLRWIPQTRRRAYAYAGLVAIALLVGVVAGCGGGSGGGGGGGGGSTRTIGASYSGDTNYQKSTATPIVITIQ
jgi:hypothetical protein